MINDILDFLDMRQLSIILISFELYYNIISTNEMKFIMSSHHRKIKAKFHCQSYKNKRKLFKYFVLHWFGSCYVRTKLSIPALNSTKLTTYILLMEDFQCIDIENGISTHHTWWCIFLLNLLTNTENSKISQIIENAITNLRSIFVIHVLSKHPSTKLQDPSQCVLDCLYWCWFDFDPIKTI